MKKVLYIMLFLILGMSATAQSVWNGKREAISNGSGTESDPYLIENAQQLAWLVYTINWDYSHWASGKYFLLTTDIDLGGNADNQWIPIGAGPSVAGDKYFNGVFDGGFHEITGLYIDSNNAVNDNNSKWWVSDYVGFFTELGTNAVVKNLYLEGSIVCVRNIKVGGFSGKDGIFEYCTSNVNIETSQSMNTAGIAAFGNPKVRFSANLGNIKGRTYVGGIISINGTVENCYNVGNIEGVNAIGGIAGASNKIKNCYNVGNIVYDEGAKYKGAIVGRKSSGANNIDNCYYLEGCIAESNEYGEPKSAEFMRSQDFVNLLNNDITIWTMDTENINDGYPIFDEEYMNVSEITENTDMVVVYPNPVIDNVYVVGDVISCAIYDLVGKCVKPVWTNVDKISVTDLNPGIYMMRFITNNGNVVTKKIVKK